MINSKVEKIVGRAIPLRGDDIDTDRIVPARYLRCVTFDGLGEHVFEDDRKQDLEHSFNQERYQGASILVVGRNFGCGSSREHAPQALSKWGIIGIIGESFAEIFFSNCQAIGIPCLTVQKMDSNNLFAAVEKDPSLVITMNVKATKIVYGGTNINGHIPAGIQRSFLEGTWNATEVLLQEETAIHSLAAQLPYLNDFTTPE